MAKDFDFNRVLHKMGQNGDPKLAAQQYLDWCDDHGYTPKFDEFRDNPNYYKLLEDFTVYDKDGKYVPQREVRAVFPKADNAFGSMKELIKSGLEEDAVIEGKRDANLSKIVDEIEKSLPRTEAEIEETEVSQAETDLEAEERYSYKNLPADAFYKDGRIYDYDFLTAQKDMVVLKNLPSLNDVKTNNRIDNDKVVSMGIQSCLAAGAKKVGNRYAVKNTYTGRNLMVGDNSITHGLGNIPISEYRTNARLGAIIGDICQNAIPINGLPNTHKVAGTYAMIAVVESSFNDRPAPLIARLVVEQGTHNVESVDFIDSAHALSGRVQKNNEERWSAEGTPVDENVKRGTTSLFNNQYTQPSGNCQ